MSQLLHCDNIKLLDSKTFTHSEYVSTPRKGAYAANICRPYVMYKLLKCAQIQQLKEEDEKVLNQDL